MSWGYRIAILYIVFISGILFMVFRTSSVKVELVADDYYEQELKYQEVIDARANSVQLSSPVIAEHKNNTVHISFPEEMKNFSIDADINMYCPVDRVKDFSVAKTVYDGKIFFNMPEASKGLYIMKLNWKANDVKYYTEQKMNF